MKIVIFAGGRGSRMHKLTDTINKCLLNINNKPVIHYVIDSVISAFDPDEITFSISYLSDLVKESVQDYLLNKQVKPFFIQHDYREEIRNAYIETYASMGRPVEMLAVPGDIITESTVYKNTVSFYKKSNYALGMTFNKTKINEVDTHAVAEILPNGSFKKVLLYKSYKIENKLLYRDMGINVFDRKAIELMKTSNNPSVIGSFIELSKTTPNLIGAYVTSKPWLHVGYPTDLQKDIYQYFK